MTSQAIAILRVGIVILNHTVARVRVLRRPVLRIPLTMAVIGWLRLDIAQRIPMRNVTKMQEGLLVTLGPLIHAHSYRNQRTAGLIEI